MSTKTIIPEELKGGSLGDDYQRVAEEIETATGKTIEWQGTNPYLNGVDISFSFLYPHQIDMSKIKSPKINKNSKYGKVCSR